MFTLPCSSETFDDAFPTVNHCLNYLRKLSWGKYEYLCPRCSWSLGYTIKKRAVIQCANQNCRYQASLTSGTIFHHTKLCIRSWFKAIVHFCENRNVSVRNLAQLAKLSYKTAWLVLTKLKIAYEQCRDEESTYTSGQDNEYDPVQKINYETGCESGYQSGNEIGYESGNQSGDETGYESGYQSGYQSGNETGYKSGDEMGNESGHQSGYKMGNEMGFEIGNEMGHETKYVSDYEIGTEQAVEGIVHEDGTEDMILYFDNVDEMEFHHEGGTIRYVRKRKPKENIAAQFYFIVFCCLSVPPLAVIRYLYSQRDPLERYLNRSPGFNNLH